MQTASCLLDNLEDSYCFKVTNVISSKREAGSEALPTGLRAFTLNGASLRQKLISAPTRGSL